MPSSQPEARVLTKRYRFALVLVALLSVLSQALIQIALERQESDAALINIAGRQRMLSQRLSKAALELHHPDEGLTSPAAARELEESLLLWETTHAALTRGGLRDDAARREGHDIARLMRATEPSFLELGRAVRTLLATAPGTDHHDAEIVRAQDRILDAETHFLAAMERVVAGLQRAAERKLLTLRTIQWALTGLTLLVLMLEARFVFAPAAGQISRTLTRLRATQHALEENQSELENKVEQRTTELALREQQFREIFERATVGMAQVEPFSGRFLRVNPFLCRMLGYEEHELLRRTFSEITHPEERGQDLESFQRMVRGDEATYRAEKRYLRSDGQPVWVQVSAVLLQDERGRPERTVTIVQDINARVAAEQALRQSEEHFRVLAEATQRSLFVAEDESRSKDEFVALVSHELRTPLTAMLGWAGVLRERGADPELLARAVEIIERNAKTQSRLVEDLLDMSRIISGKMAIERAPVALVPALAAALDTVRPSADQKKIALELEVPEGPCVVLGDARRLQQIFWNLLNNAIKFTPEGGRVHARVERSDALVVSITDNGRGISAALLPHVFERFQQGQRSTERSQGLGLGLAIVKQLVELHEGTISVSSEGEGQGSCFTVTLPSHRSSAG